MSHDVFTINDPIHGLMQFRDEEAEIVKAIITTPEFQRLRYIKQLGMAFFVYPGANHNRFSHSLGTAYLAKRLVEKFNRDSSDNISSKKELSNSAIIIALLHDIGHGPYSHMFERIKYDNIKFDHEKMTTLIINSLSDTLTKYHNELGQISNLLDNKNNQNTKEESGNNQIIKSLISSQLDVDRMDYLLRDSHFCGVDYGNYDKKWLLHGIQLCAKGDKYIVGINRKAIGVVEHYLMARRLMTNCIYKHPKVVAAEYLLSCFIKDLYENLTIFLDRKEYKHLLLIKYLDKIKETKTSDAALDEFLKISDIDVEMIVKLIAIEKEFHRESFKMIADLLYYRNFPMVYEIDYTRYDEVDILINQFKEKTQDIKDWQLQLDDRNIKTYKNNNEKIYVIDDRENIKSIDALSLPIFSMADKNEVNPILIIDINIVDNPSVKELVKSLDSKCCLAVCGGSKEKE